jgi:hypothetical protein
MKTLQIIFALVVIVATSFVVNAQDSFNGMKASILRSTNPQLVSYAKLHEAANLQLDVKNVQKIIIDENANIACLVYPIIGGKYECHRYCEIAKIHLVILQYITILKILKATKQCCCIPVL